MFDSTNRDSRTHLSERMMAYWAQFARSGDPGRGGRDDLPRWPAWDASRQKLEFGVDRIGALRSDLSLPGLAAALFDDSRINAADRCAIYLDNMMYPDYPLADLAAHGCAPPQR
jgi:para-nitrobenzyl esterase